MGQGKDGRNAGRAPRWDNIDTVLLDMDGTLLDKHFDDHFWEQHVPLRYAEARGVPLEEARSKLLGLYRSRQGTLDWTDLDFWSQQLGLDIPVLKKQVEHLIEVHPYVLPFLDRVREVGKHMVLVTNAHGKTLELKMEKTALAGRFDAVFTSHQMGAPKEEPGFWQALERHLDFEAARTMLAEDTEACLVSADRYGIGYLVYVSLSSSTRPPDRSSSFYNIDTFREIMP